MSRSQWFQPPCRLLVLFLAVAVVPAAALAWPSWRLFEQDRALENQRTQERLERAADLIGLALERRLTETTDQLHALWSGAWQGLGVTLDLVVSEAHCVLEQPVPAGLHQAVRTPADTRLPWILRIASTDPEADLSRLAGRLPASAGRADDDEPAADDGWLFHCPRGDTRTCGGQTEM